MKILQTALANKTGIARHCIQRRNAVMVQNLFAAGSLRRTSQNHGGKFIWNIQNSNYQADRFLHPNQQPDNFISFISKVVESNVTLCYIFIIQMLENNPDRIWYITEKERDYEKKNS